jgi:hypothetical protein
LFRFSDHSTLKNNETGNPRNRGDTPGRPPPATPTLAAEDEPPPPAWTATVETGYYDTFLADYNGLVWFGGLVVQTSVTVAHRSGFYANLWVSSGTDGKWSANWDDEIDWALGWAGPIGFAGLQADLSVSYWDCFQVGSPMNDFWATTLKLSRPFEGKGWRLTPSLVAQFAWATQEELVYADGTTGPAEGGSVWGVNLDASVDLCRFAAIVASTGVFWDGGSYGYADAVIWESSLSLNWKITDRLTLSLPTVRVASPLTSTDRDTVWVWGAVATVSF